MGAHTHIQWCDHTFNPWEGCTKVSAGCKNCYAEARNARFAGGAATNWGPGAPRRRTSESNWKLPLKWNAAAGRRQRAFDDMQAMTAGHHGLHILARRTVVNRQQLHHRWSRLEGAASVDRAVPPPYPVAQNFIAPESDRPHRPRVFCASLADWLDGEVQIDWLCDLLALIHATPNLDWLLLTKRPECFHDRVRRVIGFLEGGGTADFSDLHSWLVSWLARPSLGGQPPANVWVGASVEDQENANRRIPELLKIPARVRFLSMEPLLGDVDLISQRWTIPETAHSPKIDWVIIGGESGRGARPCDLVWIRSLVNQCWTAGVACFVKQLGSQPVNSAQPDLCTLSDPKGGDLDEWPEDLRVRKFPAATMEGCG